MDRMLSSKTKKQRWLKEFEWLDLVPYSIAALMLLMEVYILLGFLALTERIAH